MKHFFLESTFENWPLKKLEAREKFAAIIKVLHKVLQVKYEEEIMFVNELNLGEL